MGIDIGRKAKLGSKSGMTSKGGSIGKKEREVVSMAKGSIGFDGNEAAKEEKPEKEQKGKK